MQPLKNSSRIPVLPILFIATISLFGAGVLTLIIGNSHVDIGLDLLCAPAAAPTLTWDGREGPPIKMKRINERFSPIKSWFELTNTGQSNPKAFNTEVWLLNFPYPEKIRQTPPNSWLTHGDGTFLSFSNLPATLRFEGSLPASAITLRRHGGSSTVTLRTAAGMQTLDLYRASEDTLTVPIPPVAQIMRFHALVPRSVIRHLHLAVPGTGPAALSRLMIGSYKPVIFSPSPDEVSERTYGQTIIGPLNLDGAAPLPMPARTALETGGTLTFIGLFLLLGVSLGILRVLCSAALELIRRLLKDPLENCGPAPFSLRTYIFSWLRSH